MNKHSRFTSNGFKLAAMALAISGAGSVMAANNDTASATTTVIAPIAIAKTADLSFGSIAATAAAGTVTLTPGGNVSATGAVVAGGTAAAAQFTVSGETGKTYTLTVAPTTLTGPGTAMAFTPISDYTASAVTTSNAAAGTLSGAGTGTQSVFVGGTLAVAANQAAGSYTGNFTATVTYN